MPPLQNTFSAIPNVPSLLNGNHHDSAFARPSKPPMTTKQVKRAHQKANKGPKLSKAEQRRQELFEQDRIRKEFEKEKNQARARAARDKKKEKEERERAEKKKKGLPLVDVRPSQDTIARFIRAKPTRQGCHSTSDQTRESEDADKENIPPPEQTPDTVDTADSSDGLGDAAEPLKKRRKVEARGQSEEANGVGSLSPERNPQVSASGGRVGGRPGSGAAHDNYSIVDPIEESLLDHLLREAEGAYCSSDMSGERICTQKHDRNPPPESPPPQPLENKAPTPKTTKNPSPLLGSTARPTRSLLSPNRSATSPATAPSMVNIQPQSRFLKPHVPPTRAVADGLRHSRMTKPEHDRDNEPPPSTQLFLLSHLDDFFPSPSQEVREIFEGPQQIPTGNRDKPGLADGHTSHKALQSHPYAPKTPITPYHRSGISPPGVTPRRNRHIQQTANHLNRQKAAAQPFVRPAKPIQPLQPLQSVSTDKARTFEMPFFSTQDLVLSSQDVKDIEQEPPPPLKPPSPAPVPPGGLVKPRNPTRPPPKPFFTSSCREMRYKYALERSRTTAWEGPSAQQKARKELDRLQALEDERLERLLADPGNVREEGHHDSVATKKASATVHTTQFHGSPTLQAHPPRRVPLESVDTNGQVPPGSDTRCSTRELPDSRVPRRESGSSGTSQKNTRSKGSYEAMLELLAKGPKQKSGAHFDKNADKGRDTIENREGSRDQDGGGGDSGYIGQITPEEVQAMTTTIPASQETDYGCGEEWDDDDLLRDMLL